MKEKIIEMDSSAKLKIGVIGVGNAGCQVAIKAHKEGYNCLLINSSAMDLSAAIIDTEIPSLLIGDKRGCGKNRKVGKSFIKNRLNHLFKEDVFMNAVKPFDIVVLCASTAGGTGSGMTPTLARRIEKEFPTKIVMIHGILPKISESINAQSNTVEFVSEVIELDISYMLTDLAVYEDYVNDLAYSLAADKIIESLNIIRGDYIKPTKFGMIDERDRLSILSESGYMATYKCKITNKDLDDGTIQSHLINEIKKSASAPIQRDKIVKEIGIMICLPSELEEKAKSGNYNELTSFTGMPIDIFENYAIGENMVESDGSVALILSGMTAPYDRIVRCNDIVDSHINTIRRVNKRELNSNLESALGERNLSKIIDLSEVVDASLTDDSE